MGSWILCPDLSSMVTDVDLMVPKSVCKLSDFYNSDLFLLVLLFSPVSLVLSIRYLDRSNLANLHVSYND